MVINFFFLLALSLSSLYVFPSGNPQPADFIFIVFILLTTLSYFSFPTRVGKGVILLDYLGPPFMWIFVFVVFVVSLVWSIILQDAQFFLFFAFYLFNALLVVALIIRLHCNESFRYVFLLALKFAVIVSGIGVILSLMGGGASVRVTGFFNNPNQLAFYSLLIWSCILVLTRAKISLNPLYWLAFIFSALGVFAAASLGAMGGFVVLVFVMILRNLSPTRAYRIFLPSLCVFVVTSVIFSGYINLVSTNVDARLARASSKLEDVNEERKYDRIAAFPGYLLVGAGEGRDDRFRPYDGGEIHSTPGNILFAYGFLGLAVFLLSWIFVLRKSPYYVWLIALAPAVYSLTHMGLRTTLFWILLALIWSEFGVKKSSPRIS